MFVISLPIVLQKFCLMWWEPPRSLTGHDDTPCVLVCWLQHIMTLQKPTCISSSDSCIFRVLPVVSFGTCLTEVSIRPSLSIIHHARDSHQAEQDYGHTTGLVQRLCCSESSFQQRLRHSQANLWTMALRVCCSPGYTRLYWQKPENASSHLEWGKEWNFVTLLFSSLSLLPMHLMRSSKRCVIGGIG